MFGTGEALAVQLFFWTITITALAMYATQAGWTHRLFLHGLLLIAVVTFFIGAFWGRLGGIVPAASSFLTGAVTSGFAWIGLLLFVFSIVLYREYQFRKEWVRTNSRAPAIGPQPQPLVSTTLSVAPSNIAKELPDLVPVREAARIAYEQTRTTTLAEDTERDSNSADDIIKGYARVLMAISRVHGQKVPSTVYEEINSVRLARFNIEYLEDSVRAVEREGSRVYANLCFDKNQLVENIAHINRAYV